RDPRHRRCPRHGAAKPLGYRRRHRRCGRPRTEAGVSSATASPEDLPARMRAALADLDNLREGKMFGGICLLVNGNMRARASKRGVWRGGGGGGQPHALARGATLATMGERTMAGYVRVDPPAGETELRRWLALAVAYVKTLPPKPEKAKRPRKGAGAKR